MLKKRLWMPVLSAALLAPALLSSQVLAEEPSTVPSTENQSASSQPGTETTLATPAAEEVEAVIVHTNDVHGRILEEKSVIGDAKAATVIDTIRQETKTTLVVDAGDAFQGLPISNSSKGEERAAILNAVGYDAMAVGNHEFDFGLDEVKKYKEILNFPLLSANTYVNGARLFEAATIIDKNKEVVGDEFVVIGVTTPETATKTHPKNVQGVTFTDPISEVTKVIDEIDARAKAEGKDYKNYVILAHLGVDNTTPVEWQGSTLAQALSEKASLKGKRVIVIDGHSHTVATASYGDNVTYNQTGSYLNNIGKITLKSGKLLAEASLISAAEAKKVTPNPTILAMVEKIDAAYKADNAQIVRDENPVELSGIRENVRVRETNLGNLVADALYAYGQKGFSHPTDIAVTNGGGLRETIQKGKAITKGDIIAVLPFGNTISQITVTGQQIQEMFAKSLSSILQAKDGQPVLDENGLPLLEPSGGFLQISGARVYYNPEKPVGQRILGIQVLSHETGQYENLDVTKTYYLATNDFLAAGGDGYSMLGGAREEGPSMDTAFADYLKTVDLSTYAVINPNSRVVATREVPKEETKPEQPTEKPDKNQQSDLNVPGGIRLSNQASKNSQTQPGGVAYGAPAAKPHSSQSVKVLPKTGSDTGLAWAGLGAVLAAFSMTVQDRRKKD